ncbi:MAG: hypothetical protein ACKO7W_02220 [Elainella sp.]
MEGVNDSISTCRHCYFYHLQGRRGGHCQQLGVLVQGSWSACSLGVSPFAKWQQLIGIPAWSASDPADFSPELPEPSSVCADVLELAETELGQALASITHPREAAAALESILESTLEPVREIL